MNIIANNCCGGWFYRLHQVQFNNPFIWMVASYDSIYNAMEHFYDINWANIQLSESRLRKNTYIITVDKLIELHYVHYILSEECTELTVRPHKLYPEYDGNILGDQIWNYVVDTYMKRTRRMIASAEQPSFLIRDEKYASVGTHKRIYDIACCPVPYKRVIITKEPITSPDETKCKIIHTETIEFPKPTIEKYYNQLNGFYGLTK